MKIEAIVPLAAEMAPAIERAQGPAPVDFLRWMSAEVDAVNERIAVAETGLRDLATGATGNLHQVMLQVEEAKLAFNLTVQIRNKVLEGYQDIMRMQI
jgi:flagellar hook-basal body complex protein FliE